MGWSSRWAWLAVTSTIAAMAGVAYSSPRETATVVGLVVSLASVMAALVVTRWSNADIRLLAAAGGTGLVISLGLAGLTSFGAALIPAAVFWIASAVSIRRSTGAARQAAGAGLAIGFVLGVLMLSAAVA